MLVTHFLSGNNKESREIEGASFLVSNKTGDYFWNNGEKPLSRYSGWFCRFRNNLYRIIESIEVVDGGELREVVNGITFFEHRRENSKETFCLSEKGHSLVLETEKKSSVRVFFDMRESYSSFDFEDYSVTEKGDILLVKFFNGIFLAIKAEKGEVIKDVVSRNYSYDTSRNSPPFQRNVSFGLVLAGERFVFGAGETEHEAVKEVNKLILRRALKKEGSLDILLAENSLSNLLIEDEDGIYAGLPWFFHFWQRDEAISLKSLVNINPQKGKNVFFRLLREGIRKGPGGVVNIDAAGWLFKRADDVKEFLDDGEKEKVRRSLKKYIEEFLWAFTEKGLAINKPHETWMDSLDRRGARIEIQAMRMNMYKLASSLATRGNEKKIYKEMELKMKRRVRETFYKDGTLHDGYYPKTGVSEKIIRPNIFIAAYIYPELLTKEEWINCIDNVLHALWLSWGGFSTIDKESSLFCKEHTGEISSSYHQGDSWFFLNNLAAIVLYRVDPKKYKPYIEKILQASRSDLMWGGAIGCHSEVSSASELRSEGCVSQAWSSAMYLEAKKEILL